MDTNSIKLLDGGFSTQLAHHVGAKIDGDPLWTSRFLSTNPDAVFKTHLDFLRAGSNIIETNSYQASVPGFMKYLEVSKSEATDLIKLSATLARKAVSEYKKEIKDLKVDNPEPLVAGSIGSYGACLHDCSEYTGGKYKDQVSSDFIKDWHRPRFQALIDAGVDLLAIETIPCAMEAKALVSLLSEFPDIKAWLSFSCKDDTDIADGSNFKEIANQCYRKASPGQLLAVGVNCCNPRLVTSLLKGLNMPLIVYPNSGEKYSTTIGSWTIDNDFHPPEEFVQNWMDLGVQYLGGCCRVDADEISRIGAEIKKWIKNQA